MMLQFRGREEELVETLQTMEERMTSTGNDSIDSETSRELASPPASSSGSGEGSRSGSIDPFSSPYEVFEGSVQGSVISRHQKTNSAEISLEDGSYSEIGDIVVDSDSENGNAS